MKLNQILTLQDIKNTILTQTPKQVFLQGHILITKKKILLLHTGEAIVLLIIGMTYKWA